MGESNGTNLKPIPSILFFKQAYENWGVLILRPDGWRERSRSISTPRGREVLMCLVLSGGGVTRGEDGTVPLT